VTTEEFIDQIAAVPGFEKVRRYKIRLVDLPAVQLIPYVVEVILTTRQSAESTIKLGQSIQKMEHPNAKQIGELVESVMTAASWMPGDKAAAGKIVAIGFIPRDDPSRKKHDDSNEESHAE